MAHYAVRESPPLRGEIPIGTSKNAVLPIMCGALLTGDDVRIEKPPQLTDVTTLTSLLRACGCRTHQEEDALVLRAQALCNPQDDADVRRMRASVLVLGPLLARLGEARIPLPGGCAIGQRPIDQHLKGMSALGAKVAFDHGGVTLTGRLRGAVIYLDMPSVGATENLMMAAVLTKGETIIRNDAREPEIVDLQGFINAMGGRVSGAGSSIVRIRGVDSLHGAAYQPIADRITAGTLLTAAAMTGGEIALDGFSGDSMDAVLAKLREAGCLIDERGGGLTLSAPGRLRAVDVFTQPYPGFPTDMQAQMMALCCVAEGTSIIVENVFESRFSHAAQLVRMGADITVHHRTAVVRGGRLTGARVTARDLRAGAALVLAALAADGMTEVENISLIDRGYERLEETLTALGARIRRV